MSGNVRQVDGGFILPFRKGLFLLYLWNESPFSFCPLDLKLAKMGESEI